MNKVDTNLGQSIKNGSPVVSLNDTTSEKKHLEPHRQPSNDGGVLGHVETECLIPQLEDHANLELLEEKADSTTNIEDKIKAKKRLEIYNNLRKEESANSENHKNNLRSNLDGRNSNKRRRNPLTTDPGSITREGSVDLMNPDQNSLVTVLVPQVLDNPSNAGGHAHSKNALSEELAIDGMLDGEDVGASDDLNNESTDDGKDADASVDQNDSSNEMIITAGDKGPHFAMIASFGMALLRLPTRFGRTKLLLPVKPTSRLECEKCCNTDGFCDPSSELSCQGEFCGRGESDV